jgi:integrase
MAGSAARPGEALALRWCDVDFVNRVISIRHSVKRSTIHGQGRLGATKTRGSIRDVPIGILLAESLKRERANQVTLLQKIFAQPANGSAVQPLVQPQDCIFHADLAQLRNVPCSLSGMRSRFKAACRRASLPASTTPHQLRHSAITIMIAGSSTQRGISVIEAAKLAGHSDPGTTSKIYAHAVDANLKRGADLADGLIAARPADDLERLRNEKNASSDK